ncbi:MAG TPA: ABC transporter substrate-binding protein [Eubacteriaceae bacterium]|nr:ABC transporter substrate-binding protein [Eubacteriaceae bacterium]
MKKKIRFKNLVVVFLLGAVALFSFACSDSSPQEGSLEETTVILDWTPNTNHTGLYVALEKGYYEEEGLDVEIIPPSEGSSTTLIATGQGDFGVTYQEDVTYALTSEDPLPVTAIAAIIQENTSGFASRKSAGIESVSDFEGKAYGGWGSPSEEAVLKAVMSEAGADYQNVENVNIGSDDFFAATEGAIDFVWIFEGWTGVEARLRGVDLNYLPVKDLHESLNYYTPVLITNEPILEEDPEKIEKFLRATQKGYQFCIENPEEAAQVLLAAVPELEEELVVESQKFLAEEYSKGVDRWGVMEEKRWADYANFLLENDLIDKELEIDRAFTNEFLPK